MKLGVEVVAAGDTATVTLLDPSLLREVAGELMAVGGKSVKFVTGVATGLGFVVPLTVAQQAGYAPLEFGERLVEKTDAPAPEQVVPEVEVAQAPKKRAPRKAAAPTE